MTSKNMIQILVPLAIDHVGTLGHGRDPFTRPLGLPLDLYGVMLVEKSGRVLEGQQLRDVRRIHRMQQLNERHQRAIVGGPRSTKQSGPFRHPLQLLQKLVLGNVAEIVVHGRFGQMVLEIRPFGPHQRCLLQLTICDASQRLGELDLQITVNEALLEAPIQGGERCLLLMVVLAVFSDPVEPPVDEGVAHPAIEDRELNTLWPCPRHRLHHTAQSQHALLPINVRLAHLLGTAAARGDLLLEISRQSHSSIGNLNKNHGVGLVNFFLHLFRPGLVFFLCFVLVHHPNRNKRAHMQALRISHVVAVAGQRRIEA
mmetsp:Transcript_35932/g.78496  ORF Transcript_35932/g.78496 Transcript_35932/m.78496 type:complete len:314 (-) Transcript_35932:135-1076(-)